MYNTICKRWGLQVKVRYKMKKVYLKSETLGRFCELEKTEDGYYKIPENENPPLHIGDELVVVEEGE